MQAYLLFFVFLTMGTIKSEGTRVKAVYSFRNRPASVRNAATPVLKPQKWYLNEGDRGLDKLYRSFFGAGSSNQRTSETDPHRLGYSAAATSAPSAHTLISTHNRRSQYQTSAPRKSASLKRPPHRSPVYVKNQVKSGSDLIKPPQGAKYVVKQTIIHKTPHHDYGEDGDYDSFEVEDDEDDFERSVARTTTTMATTTSEATTAAPGSTPAPFGFQDIKVPSGFLRIEYMIGFTFFGIMYGLGFLVIFQSVCVPVAKFFTFLSYIWAVYWGIIEPTTKQEAMQYLPPD